MRIRLNATTRNHPELLMLVGKICSWNSRDSATDYKMAELTVERILFVEYWV